MSVNVWNPSLWGSVGGLSGAGGGGGDPGGGDPTGGPHRYWRVRFLNTYDLSYGALAEIKMASSLGGADLTTTGQTIVGDDRPSFLGSAAFDNDPATAWSFDKPAGSALWWVGQDFGSAVEIVEVKLTGRNDNFYEQGPTGWVLEYSDDATDWTEHWRFEREAPWVKGEERTYTATETALDETAATHWRVFGSKSDNSQYLHIGELEMSETAGGGFSDETSTGAAIAGQARSGFGAEKAFDNILTGNNSWGGAKTDETTLWVGQAFATAKDIVQIKLSARNDSFEEQTPRSFAVQKSLDSGITWITVWNVTDEAIWTAGETRTYTKP